MLTVLPPTTMLEETAVAASDGGVVQSLRADPEVPTLHHAVVRRGAKTLYVALDTETHIAEVSDLGALSAAA